jgi:hypothetical protein
MRLFKTMFAVSLISYLICPGTTLGNPDRSSVAEGRASDSAEVARLAARSGEAA